MADEDNNKDRLQSPPATARDNIEQQFDQFIVLQEASESDLFAKQCVADECLLLVEEMSVMGGMEVIKRMKESKELRNLPIVMQASSDKPKQVKEGIDAGVFYYLTKPVSQEVLKSVLSAAIRETEQQRFLSHELRKHKTSFNLIDTCKFRFRTLAEAEHLATFLANCFPDAERAVGGLAELLINAVEHGNLGITYEEKSRLVADGTWREGLAQKNTRIRKHRPPTAASRKAGTLPSLIRAKDLMGNTISTSIRHTHKTTTAAASPKPTRFPSINSRSTALATKLPPMSVTKKALEW